MTPIPTLTVAQEDAVLGFEGPEKKLEIQFKPVPGDTLGLRKFPKQVWDPILETVHCQIVSTMINEHCTSFVLSESSLFVYPYKILLKTCGTITLLLSLPALKELAATIGSEFELITFNRKSLNWPKAQKYPHTCFVDEVDYLKKCFNKGEDYTLLRPEDKDQWFFYVADFRSEDTISKASQQVFDVMMHDLDPDVMKLFYHKEGVSKEETTRVSGIASLLPGSIIDECQFEPCGYSMNGLLGDSYWTIHITPEPHCSYASFETNVPFESYTGLLEKVLKVFKPGRATISVVADANAPCGDPADSFNPHVMEPKFKVISHTTQPTDSHAHVVASNIVYTQSSD